MDIAKLADVIDAAATDLLDKPSLDEHVLSKQIAGGLVCLYKHPGAVKLMMKEWGKILIAASEKI